jgi:hypothetical protein
VQHRRHAFYRGLVESKAPFKPAFDDDVSPGSSLSGYNIIPTICRVTIRFIQQIQRKNLSVNGRGRMCLDLWPVIDLKPC